MHYQVLLSNPQVQVGVYYASGRGFDLCILDGPSLIISGNGCKQEKRQEQPVFSLSPNRASPGCQDDDPAPVASIDELIKTD